MKRLYAPIVPGGKRAARNAKNPKTAVSVSLSPDNFDWCVDHAKVEMISLSCFIDEMITARRGRLERSNRASS